MSLPKYYKKDLINMGNQGYKFIHCKTEEEALNLKSKLKSEGKCAQAGFVINREDKEIIFVATKERGNKSK